MARGWQPSLGACVEPEGVRFRVWAPLAMRVEVVVEPTASAPGQVLLLHPVEQGYHAGFFPGLEPGTRYRYRVDGAGPFPDPASRFQPLGVHGPSEVVDPNRFTWSADAGPSLTIDHAVIYELHVGTFTPAGTFAGVQEKLPELVDLGVTAIELMPLGDFPGQRNWGYDGVSLFAPARCYGTPDDLRRLVDTAHRLGLAVLLDVVYNHLGPDGNYLGCFSPHYRSTRPGNPWGDDLNFDGPHSAAVRDFFFENALYWLHEFRLDGLRLDATHAILDDCQPHFLAELVQRVREVGRPALLIAEDLRNLDYLVRPTSAGGYGLDAIWCDDFHHQARRLLAGDHEGYYRDYAGTMADLATTIRHGWFYQGQYAVHYAEPRGTDPTGITPSRCVYYLQNHDQIGNRAQGDRLHQQIDGATWRAASALLLTLPQTPLLFMGQEWAASTPFLYFTDHEPALGQAVAAGRQHDHRHYAAFDHSVPDPQERSTFTRCVLDWEEASHEPHASIRRLYRTLLRLRRTEPTLTDACPCEVHAWGPDDLVVRRRARNHLDWLILVRLRGRGPIDLAGLTLALPNPGQEWELVLTTEDTPFSPSPRPPRLTPLGPGLLVDFAGPAALLLRAV